MTPELEQLCDFVEHELTNEHCAGPCHICSGRERGRPGLPPWSVVLAAPDLPFGQYHPRQPSMLHRIRQLHTELDRMRRVLLVRPADVTRVQAAVDQLPIECLPGLIEVRASEFVREGQMILADPNPPVLPIVDFSHLETS